MSRPPDPPSQGGSAGFESRRGYHTKPGARLLIIIRYLCSERRGKQGVGDNRRQGVRLPPDTYTSRIVMGLVFRSGGCRRREAVLEDLCLPGQPIPGVA